MMLQAYKNMLIQAVKDGKITHRKAKKLFNLFLESSLDFQKVNTAE